MNMSELTVAVLQIELNGADGFGSAATYLGDSVFEPIRQFDPGTMLGTGDRIADRLAHRFQQSRDVKPSPPGFDIDLKIDRHEQRWELIRRHGAQYPPDGGHLF